MTAAMTRCSYVAAKGPATGSKNSRTLSSRPSHLLVAVPEIPETRFCLEPDPRKRPGGQERRGHIRTFTGHVMFAAGPWLWGKTLPGGRCPQTAISRSWSNQKRSLFRADPCNALSKYLLGLRRFFNAGRKGSRRGTQRGEAAIQHSLRRGQRNQRQRNKN